MTTTSIESTHAPEGREIAAPTPRSRVLGPGAFLTLVKITAARQNRGRRLLVIAILFTLPIVLGALIRRYSESYLPELGENLLVFVMIFQALMPITALLFASGMVQDDVEEQTMTYVMIRPIPRWAIYLAKAAATFLVSFVRAAFFTILTLAVVHLGTGTNLTDLTLKRGPIVLGLLALALAAYVAIFGLLSLVTRRTLVIGAIYIVVFEGALAYIDFAFRNATVMYHIRVLSVRWLEIPAGYYAIDPETAPAVSTSLIVLGSVTTVVLFLGAWIFSIREFRLKTPDGT